MRKSGFMPVNAAPQTDRNQFLLYGDAARSSQRDMGRVHSVCKFLRNPLNVLDLAGTLPCFRARVYHDPVHC